MPNFEYTDPDFLQKQIEGLQSDVAALKTAVAAPSASSNTPSAKCYSIDCPAIWYDKCTSSKYKDCCVREGE
jgi:hypothetical protein